MFLGFVSAILPDFSLEEIFAFASENGFECVELMCWPKGHTERRYAGVAHVDATDFTRRDAEHVKQLAQTYKVAISGLGYYPNPLAADPAERETTVTHLRKLIAASALLGVNVVNTFIGRDPSKSIEDNWPMFEEVWPPIVAFAEQQGVGIGIENCPMLFSLDEWPGGTDSRLARNLADVCSHSEQKLWQDLNPSHLIWQHRLCPAIHDPATGSYVHAKDEDHARFLYRRGILGLKWHVPKLPGLAVSSGAGSSPR
jgi:sugar phosphate isomerase/epimerase